MMDNLHDEQTIRRWNAGFVFEWTAAFSENNFEYFFTSIVIPEAITGPLPIISIEERQVGDRGGTRRQGYFGQVEYFAVYIGDIQKVYLIPTVHATGTLRLKETKNKQEKLVRWAKDYEL